MNAIVTTAVALALLLPNADAKLPALPEAEQAAWAAIGSDKAPNNLTKGYHFIVSDERRHDLYRPVIDNKGGVFIGIGTNQNFAMAAWARSELLVLVDFDQYVVNTHDMYRVAFLTAPDPAAFMQLFSKAGAKVFAPKIAAYYASDEKRRRAAVHALHYGRGRIWQRLNEVKGLHDKSGVSIFLNDKAEYDHLVDLWRSNRVYAYRGDLLKPVTLTAIAAVLKRFGRTVSVFYLSNTEQYFGYRKQFRANITGMPTAAKSEILRTHGWRPKNAAGKKVGRVNYIYITQAYDSFKQWLGTPGLKSAIGMYPRRFFLRNVHYRIEHLPGQPPAPIKAGK